MTNSPSDLPYHFRPERGAYGCEASRRQILREEHHCHLSFVEADTTFNWGARRGDLLLVSGDFPRFAFLTRRRERRTDPPHLKIGDGRLALETEQGVFRWEDASSITAAFHPTSTEHVVRWAKLPGIVGRLKIGLIGGQDAVLLVSIDAEAGAAFSGHLVLDFGGISTHGRTFSAAYFPADAVSAHCPPVEISGNVATISCSHYPERVAARFGGNPELHPREGYLTAKWPVRLKAGGHFETAGTWRLSTAPEASPALPLDPSSALAALAKAEEEGDALLAQAAADTPEGTIGHGLEAAVLTLENCYDQPGWLEGVHWWSCYWANNYQISAAIALGQWGRARRALEFFLDDDGHCSAHKADGSRMDIYDALPFGLRQLAAYVDATGDKALVLKLRPSIEKCIAALLAARETPSSGLFNWNSAANATVYQADHLGWPGEATSISFLMASALREWGRLCRETGDSSAGAGWMQKADHIERQARARLWDDAQGCFFSHRDEEDHTFRSRYYSDHVFPVLYGNVLSPPEAAHVLDVLRRELIFETAAGRLLMRVGTYLPQLFATSNVMPTQMAEAAMAFARLGQGETAARLLSAVALAATLDTESPGTFPERLSDFGKGECNYNFGNPAGAYAMAVINGLFGVALTEGGEACSWTPGFPGDWPSARLHLPWVDLGYAKSAAAPGMETRRYDYAAAQPRRLQFRVFLPVADAYRVTIDQRPATFTASPGVGGTWLSLPAYPTQKTSIEISFTPKPVEVSGPGVVTSGSPAQWQIPARAVTLDDPAKSMREVQLNEGKLTGTPAPAVPAKATPNTIYATLKSPATIVPIAFTTVPPVTLASFDLLVGIALSSAPTATLRLQFRPGPESPRAAELTVDLAGQHFARPWRGEETLSLDVPAPRSGGVLAAIPLQLRVKMVSPDGTVWMDQETTVHPRGADPVMAAALRNGRAGQSSPVSLADLPQSSTLHVEFPWRYTPRFDLQLRAHAGKGLESDGEIFPVRADRDSFCLIDGGISDRITRRLLPSTLPKSVTIPIQRRACAVSLLFASEMELRVCNGPVGDIRFVYSEGPEKIVPLVANVNFDTLRDHSAPECSPVPISWCDNLNLLRLPCDRTRTLVQITLALHQRDARLALIALHTFAA